MFKKLKQKIQEEGVDLSKGFPNPPVTGSGSSESGAKGVLSPSKSAEDGIQRRNRSKESSSDSLNDLNGCSEASCPNSFPGFSITDSPSSPVTNENSQNRLDFEQKIKDLSRSLRDETKQKEKLENMLEKQQSTHKRRIEEKETEFKKKLVALEEQCSDLNTKLLEANAWKEKYIRDHDAVEELEGFQTQELAKVKHLLLMSQQDLGETKDSLKEKERDLIALRSRCLALEEDLVLLKGDKSRLDEECTKAKEQMKKDADKINELRELNENLGKRVVDLNRQIEDNETQTSQLHRLLSELRDEHEAMKHGYEQQVKRYNNELEEKNTTITHLEGRVTVLEKRLANNDLGDDDKLKSLTDERDALEVKLEECRQHLNEVKSNWSEKIEVLETQIAHLNQKMADDRDEAIRIEESKSKLVTQVSELMQQLEDKSEVNKELTIKLERNEEELKRQRADLRAEVQFAYRDKEEAKKLLEERIESLESRLSSVEKERDKEISLYQGKVANLEKSATEHLSKENSLEKQNFLLRDDKSLLEKKCEKLESEIGENIKLSDDCQKQNKEMIEKIQELRSLIDEKDKHLTMLREKCGSLEENLKSSVEERNSMNSNHERYLQEAEVVRIELSSEREERRLQVETMQSKLEELRLALESAKDEGQKLREKVADLEVTMDANQNGDSERLSELQSTVSNLETQLVERNKTIKLQQQRIGDMKKTLQRELKAQSGVTMDANFADVDQSFALQYNSSRVPSNVPLGSFAHGRPCSLADKLDDINFRYIKHVVLKFITSSEYEALQLIKAIGVLLDFTNEEEQLVRQTLDWKTSWFGSKPQVTRPHVGNRTVMS